MKKNKGFIFLTALLIVITALCITGTVKSQTKNDMKIDAAYFKQMEQEYVREIRAYLNEEGFENSGVMLTYITTGGNGREYTITVHHEKLTELSEAERQNIRSRILAMAFDIPECSFRGEFLFL